MKYTRPVITAVFAVLIFLAGNTISCSFNSDTAGGKQTNQAMLDLSVPQFNHLFGWEAGDPQRIDMPDEIDLAFWTAFWKLDDLQRQGVFDSLTWPAIHALCGYGAQKMELNEAGGILPVETQRLRYRKIIALLDQRYQLGIGAALNLKGMKYLLSAPGKDDGFGGVQVLQFFQPNGLANNPSAQVKAKLYMVGSDEMVKIIQKDDMIFTDKERYTIDMYFP